MWKPAPKQVEEALARALDEVSAQALALSAAELLGTDDLEWSFDGPERWWIFVAAKRQGLAEGRLALTVTATARSRYSPRVRSAQTSGVAVQVEG